MRQQGQRAPRAASHAATRSSIIASAGVDQQSLDDAAAHAGGQRAPTSRARWSSPASCARRRRPAKMAELLGLPRPTPSRSGGSSRPGSRMLRDRRAAPRSGRADRRDATTTTGHDDHDDPITGTARRPRPRPPTTGRRASAAGSCSPSCATAAGCPTSRPRAARPTIRSSPTRGYRYVVVSGAGASRARRRASSCRCCDHRPSSGPSPVRGRLGGGRRRPRGAPGPRSSVRSAGTRAAERRT